MPSAMYRLRGKPLTSAARGCSSSGSTLVQFQWPSLTTTSWTPASSAPSTAAFSSAVRRRQPAACRGDEGSVCSSRAMPATPSMSADTKRRTACSVGVPVDDAVLPPALLLVERAVLEVADADGRRLAQRDLPLGAVVDVTVEVVDAQEAAPLLVELLEVGTASHWSQDSLR